MGLAVPGKGNGGIIQQEVWAVEGKPLPDGEDFGVTLVKGEDSSCPSEGETDMRLNHQQKTDQPDDKETLLKRLDGAFRRLGQLIDRASQLRD